MLLAAAPAALTCCSKLSCGGGSPLLLLPATPSSSLPPLLLPDPTVTMRSCEARLGPRLRLAEEIILSSGAEAVPGSRRAVGHLGLAEAGEVGAGQVIAAARRSTARR